MPPEETAPLHHTTPYGSVIDIITYNLYAADWWIGKTALLLRTQGNISGDVIEQGWQVTILKTMQKKQFDHFICHGFFAIEDPLGN